MTAWVRFINCTKYKALYLQTEEKNVPILLLYKHISKYIFCTAGSAVVSIYDLNGNFIKSFYLSVKPNVLQTIVLK